MPKITPCLWFDDNAEEAVQFYLSVLSGHDWERPPDTATQGRKCLDGRKVRS